MVMIISILLCLVMCLLTFPKLLLVCLMVTVRMMVIG